MANALWLEKIQFAAFSPKESVWKYYANQLFLIKKTCMYYRLLVSTVAKEKVIASIWNIFNGDQTITNGNSSISCCGPTFHDFGDINSVIPGDVLVTNPTCNRETQTFGSWKKKEWKFRQIIITIWESFFHLYLWTIQLQVSLHWDWPDQLFSAWPAKIIISFQNFSFPVKFKKNPGFSL